MFIGYGSLVPLEFVRVGLADAMAECFRTAVRFRGGISRIDFTTNVVMVIPGSFCWMAAFLTDSRRGTIRATIATATVLLCSAAFSVAIEFAQIWCPSRNASLTDVLAQFVGTVMGIMLWLSVGHRITNWLRTYAGPLSPRRRLDWLLRAYLVGLLIYSVFPLDLTIHPAELYDKFRNGMISVELFSNHRFDASTCWGLLFDIALFIPVGMLSIGIARPSEAASPTLLECSLIGLCVVIGIEICQIFVVSRFAEVTDLLTGGAGVVIGAYLARRSARIEPNRTAPIPSHVQQTAKWFGLAAIYASFLCVYFWSPYEPIDDTQIIKTRLDQFFRLPFSSLQRVSSYQAITQIIRKTFLFALLGMLLGKAVFIGNLAHRVRSRLLVFVLGMSAALGVTIELVQSIFRANVPDSTDCILYLLGTLFGVTIVAQFAGPPRSEQRIVKP